MADTEEQMREVAWNVIAGIPIAVLLADCIDALTEAYQIDEELYARDKEGMDTSLASPLGTYITTVQEHRNDDTTE